MAKKTKSLTNKENFNIFVKEVFAQLNIDADIAFHDAQIAIEKEVDFYE